MPNPSSGEDSISQTQPVQGLSTAQPGRPNLAGFACHVCGAEQLTPIPEYESLHRVTSDCKPWPAGGRLAVCGHCSAAQAVADTRWEREASEIYGAYTIYHQSEGAEQSVFDQASGQATARSSRLVQRLQKEVVLPERGRLLDIGCGNGALLRAFAQAIQGWSLAGVEVSDRYKDVVESIPGMERLFTGSPKDVPGQFQIISVIHTLEHIAHPREFLIGLWDKLEVGGFLVVQVPDCEQNPFMFVVADHALHCFVPVLREIVESAGFTIEKVANDWVPKEITVVARKGANEIRPRPMTPGSGMFAPVQARIDWLESLAERARHTAAHHSVGIFGTSIAATWLFAELNSEVAFFVDEDPNRIGRSHLGRPILDVTEIPSESHLFVPLPPFLARAVVNRMACAVDRLHLPDEISGG